MHILTMLCSCVNSVLFKCKLTVSVQQGMEILPKSLNPLIRVIGGKGLLCPVIDFVYLFDL